jgi:phage tail-like protein
VAVQREHPYPNFNFLVDVGLGDEIAFAEVELPAAEIDVIEYREGADRTNAAGKLPGRVRYGNVVLRRGIAGDLALWQWFKDVRDGGAQLRRDVTVTLLDEARNPVQRWRFRNAWPAKYDPSDLNAKGNEVLIETLELAVESIDVD